MVLASLAWAQVRWFCCAPGVFYCVSGTSRLAQAHSSQGDGRTRQQAETRAC